MSSLPSGARRVVRPASWPWLKPLVFVACLYPAARLVALALSGGLGANPIEFVIRSLGTWALSFLLLTLCITPLRRITGRSEFQRVRRMLGLTAFFYACLHWLSYLWADQFFDWPAIFKDILKRPFITAGMTAFLLLVPLAMTSTQAAMRRLKRNWQRVHTLVYPATMLAVLHYWWLVKRDLTQPFIYAVVLTCLLGLRMWWRLTAQGRPST